MGLFSLIAKLGLDTSSYHDKLKGAEQSSRNFSRNASRFFTLLVGENVLRASIQAVRSLGDNVDDIREKFAAVGQTIDDEMVEAIIRVNKQWDLMGLKVKTSVIPLVSYITKLFSGFTTGVEAIARLAGAATVGSTKAERQQSVRAEFNAVLRDRLVEQEHLETAIDTAMIPKTKNTARDRADTVKAVEQPLEAGITKALDNLAQIGGFSQFADGTMKNIQQEQLSELRVIKRNTESLRVRF